MVCSTWPEQHLYTRFFDKKVKKLRLLVTAFLFALFLRVIDVVLRDPQCLQLMPQVGYGQLYESERMLSED